MLSNQRCYIVPPHILRGLADSPSTDVPEAVRARAREGLKHVQAALDAHPGAKNAHRPADKRGPKDDGILERFLHNAKNSLNEGDLPGELARAEGDSKVDDKAINEAFDNVGTVLDFYKEHFNWKSIDNKNADVVSTVHFGKDYENAFWDPQRYQMVFGDGDEFLNNFTGCIDVIGHELTHAVTDHTSPLDYWGMPGALNEHVSDVFGIMVKQKVQDENAANADWLVGEDCILPGVKGTALRSMKAPGKAYDDPRFGKDPQVGHMDKWETMFEDNGGVHIFSGIPNKAFQLASVAFGGYSWEKAGQIWWKTMRSGRIPPKCTFKHFATATIDIAEKEFDKAAAKKVRKAWADVGVMANDKSPGPSGGGWCNVL